MKYFLLLFFAINLFAQENYSLRVAYGKVTDSDLGQILIGNIKSHPYDLRVLALDGGYLLATQAYNKPIDIYVKSGVSHFYEADGRDDIYEFTLYIKAYWNFFNKKVRFGLGEGLSYTSAILYTEYLEATKENDNNSNFLNYLDISIDADIGRFFGLKAFYGTSFGFAIKHRSGIYGLINNVSNGGSNYNTVYIETQF